MRSALVYLFIALFLFLSGLPLIQMKLSLVKPEGLSGVEIERKLPKLASSSFLDRSFQSALEHWFPRNTGLFGYLVKSNNEVNYTLFGNVSADYRSKVVLGKDNWLYERSYIDEYNGLNPVSDETLIAIAGRLSKLQAILTSQGIGFLVLISPSKAQLYPERIPKRYLVSTHRPQLTTRERFVPLLSEQNIHHLDGHQFLLTLKDDLSYPLFAPSGAHWNDVASCLIAQQIVQRLEEQLKQKMIQFTCAPVKIRSTPRKTDRDLSELANFWSESDTYAPTPYPVSRRIKRGAKFKPRALYVGSSFLWPVLRFMDRHNVHRRRNLYYYYSRDHRFPANKLTQIDRANLDWSKRVFSQQAIVLEINESVIQNIGFGFIEEALLAAEKGDGAVS